LLPLVRVQGTIAGADPDLSVDNQA
jgi:hypothetical protein